MFLVLNSAVLAQMPDTEIWLFKIEKTKTGDVPSTPLNITQRAGYDNQPSFSIDSKRIYYVSVKEDKQADIYSYDIRSKKTYQVTYTEISEYSPLETEPGKLYSVVVEKDSAQRVHMINAMSGIHETVIDVDSIGYYCFVNKDSMIYYKLTEPHSLQFYSLATRENKWMGNFPTRGFKAIDRHTILYGLKDSLQVTFYRYDFLLHKASRYCSYPSLNEDILWHPQLGLLKSEGTQLLRYLEQEKRWILLYDLGNFGMHKITRFGFDTKHKCLIVVDNL